MKRAIVWTLKIVAVACALPLLVGMVDLWSWVMFDRTASGIAWFDPSDAKFLGAWALFATSFVTWLAAAIAEES